MDKLTYRYNWASEEWDSLDLIFSMLIFYACLEIMT